eukprot:SM000008S22239  [mRNA]  locus=s8:500990:508732:- [translate_table: standard]
MVVIRAQIFGLQNMIDEQLCHHVWVSQWEKSQVHLRDVTIALARCLCINLQHKNNGSAKQTKLLKSVYPPAPMVAHIPAGSTSRTTTDTYETDEERRTSSPGVNLPPNRRRAASEMPVEERMKMDDDILLRITWCVNIVNSIDNLCTCKVRMLRKLSQQYVPPWPDLTAAVQPSKARTRAIWNDERVTECETSSDSQDGAQTLENSTHYKHLANARVHWQVTKMASWRKRKDSHQDSQYQYQDEVGEHRKGTEQLLPDPSSLSGGRERLRECEEVLAVGTWEALQTPPLGTDENKLLAALFQPCHFSAEKGAPPKKPEKSFASKVALISTTRKSGRRRLDPRSQNLKSNSKWNQKAASAQIEQRQLARHLG